MPQARRGEGVRPLATTFADSPPGLEARGLTPADLDPADSARTLTPLRSSVAVAAHVGQIELQLGGILRTAAAAVELGPLLDGERHVVDVAFHTGGGLQRHRHAADDAGDLAAHDHALGGDGARHLALLADDDLGAGYVALDLAVDLQRALADDLQALADDLEIVA